MAELKPCPFCGSEARGVSAKECVQDMNAYVPHTVHYIQCTKCWAKSRDLHIWKHSKDELAQLEKLVEEWNTRKGEPRKCCANCKHYCEGSGKMTTCLHAHYEYECHEPDYVCDRWVKKE